MKNLLFFFALSNVSMVFSASWCEQQKAKEVICAIGKNEMRCFLNNVSLHEQIRDEARMRSVDNLYALRSIFSKKVVQETWDEFKECERREWQRRELIWSLDLEPTFEYRCSERIKAYKVALRNTIMSDCILSCLVVLRPLVRTHLYSMLPDRDSINLIEQYYHKSEPSDKEGA